MNLKSNIPLAYVEISKNNLIHNIRQFKKLIHKDTEVIAVIKANAYGHGLAEIVKILDPHVNYFQVNSLEELEEVRAISNKQTFVLGYVQESEIIKAIKLRCILSIFSLNILKEVNEKAKKLKVVQEIHLAIDAHLGREGFLLNELPSLFKKIKMYKNINLSGMYAHFANIEDTTNFSHADKQIKEYKEAVKLAKEYGFNNLQNHISATSGLLVYEKNEGIHPLVRIGIGIYGLWPSEYLKYIYQRDEKFILKPILTWKTKIAQIKILGKGETVGYGLTFKANKKMKIALIPQGYSNGLDRRSSNKGKFLINGKYCKILGRVMMNMTVVDVSHLQNVKVEDEVVLLGKQGKMEITALDIAKQIKTINYEVVAKISSLLPRFVV